MVCEDMGGGFIECVDGLGLVGKFQKIALSLQPG